MAKICILMGSPRLNGNTAELLKPFISELENNGSIVDYIPLADKYILPCKGCIPTEMKMIWLRSRQLMPLPAQEISHSSF